MELSQRPCYFKLLFFAKRRFDYFWKLFYNKPICTLGSLITNWRARQVCTGKWDVIHDKEHDWIWAL